MAARKRKPTESFKKYRTNLKEEKTARRQALKGRVVWKGNAMTPMGILTNNAGTYIKQVHGPI